MLSQTCWLKSDWWKVCSLCRDSPPLSSTDTSHGYKQMKAKLGRRHVRAWKWVPFTNPARTDGAVLYHWRRAADEGKDYPFARFNKVGLAWLRVFNKILSTWQKLWSRWRGKKLPAKAWVSGPPRMHFQHSGARIRVFEQNTDIIKFWLFYSVTAHEYFI